MSYFGLNAGEKTRSPSILHYQLHSVEGCAECPTVLQLPELMIGRRAAGQGSK